MLQCPMDLEDKESWRMHIHNKPLTMQVKLLLLVVNSVKLHLTALYSWHFSCDSLPIHWLVNGHMTSTDETVSHQMP